MRLYIDDIRTPKNEPPLPKGSGFLISKIV